MHKFEGTPGPNDFHLDEKGILQPGLKETAHRIMPTAEQLSEVSAKLDRKAEAIETAEAEIEAKVQAAKDSLEGEQQKLRDERELFERQVAEFNKKQKQAGR